MSRIRVLPPDIVSRIAAGEVIERPASVVKELVENSIDAGATEILIEVEEGGVERVRVRDNGSGLPPEELPLAFQSHATSKLPAAEGGGQLDLFGIATLGFRGEALASIASVAEVEAVSRAAGAECGHRFRIRGGASAADGPEPVAAGEGTSIEVRNLFFNTPARRKFLRSAPAELSHVTDQAVRLALGFPGIRFTLTSGGRKLLDCPPASGLRQRLAAVIGRERAGRLLEVREPAGSAVKVRGFIGPPHLHRPDARGQHFFVDGRWVRDRVLAHALGEAYRGFHIPGQRPLAYLHVELPAGGVDVNVHPTKCEVRYADSGAVHRAAYGAVRAALEARGEARETPGTSPAVEEARERARAATLDFFASAPRERGGLLPVHRGAAAGGGEGTASPEPVAAGAVGPGPFLRQVLQSYILLEVEEGLLLFDQHALHEKVLYEKIVAGLRAGAMPRQRLLIPEVVELPPELAPLFSELAAKLGRLGFELEPFGPRQVAVQAVPAVLGDFAAGPVVLEAARSLAGGDEDGAGEPASDAPAGQDPVTARERRLAQMMACKRAVKAGMALRDEEVRALIAGARSAGDPRFCPHGRPTSVLLSREEIARRFERR